MIKYYQELLNEWKNKYRNMINTLEHMKRLKKECER